MKVLVVGGAGYVGKILRPTLLQQHDYHCFDRHPIAELGSRSIVGDVSDDAKVAQAVAGVEGIVYLAMGVKFTDRQEVQDIDLAYDVNVRGTYRFLKAGLAAGVKHFVYASTLSVYGKLRSRLTDESVPPDAWDPYGISKRLGENLCQAASQQYPDATIVALRLMLPRNEIDFQTLKQTGGHRLHALAPNDTRSLFSKALLLSKPGCHIVQATGDLGGEEFPNTAAMKLLDWSPQGQ